MTKTLAKSEIPFKSIPVRQPTFTQGYFFYVLFSKFFNLSTILQDNGYIDNETESLQ